jgi:nucleotide-binding universal stress UspA family protein
MARMMVLICYDGSADAQAAIDTALQQAAIDTASDGAQRAAAAGLVAQPRVVNRQDDIAADILAVAGELGADVIVLGTRGLSSVKSLVVGSVSRAVLHRADRPVMVIPSPALAERGHRWAEHTRLRAGVR